MNQILEQSSELELQNNICLAALEWEYPENHAGIQPLVTGLKHVWIKFSIIIQIVTKSSSKKGKKKKKKTSEHRFVEGESSFPSSFLDAVDALNALWDFV